MAEKLMTPHDVNHGEVLIHSGKETLNNTLYSHGTESIIIKPGVSKTVMISKTNSLVNE